MSRAAAGEAPRGLITRRAYTARSRRGPARGRAPCRPRERRGGVGARGRNEPGRRRAGHAACAGPPTSRRRDGPVGPPDDDTVVGRRPCTTQGRMARNCARRCPTAQGVLPLKIVLEIVSVRCARFGSLPEVSRSRRPLPTAFAVTSVTPVEKAPSRVPSPLCEPARSPYVRPTRNLKPPQTSGQRIERPLSTGNGFVMGISTHVGPNIGSDSTA